MGLLFQVWRERLREKHHPLVTDPVGFQKPPDEDPLRREERVVELLCQLKVLKPEESSPLT